MGSPAPDTCRITLVGAATTLIECGPFRLLTDPVFDPAGSRYTLRALGLIPITMRKTTGPALTPEQLAPLDAILLSHDGHPDNLDHAGRAVLETVPAVITTPAAARRLGPIARGLVPWHATQLTSGGLTLRITATPARHGPIGSMPLVGPVTGFLLEWAGQQHGPLYLTGDTLWCRPVRRIGACIRVSAAVVHLGGARFPLSGPVRYTMRARDVPSLVRALGARVIVPIHYEGWQHFREPPEQAHERLEHMDLGASLVWVAPGETVTIPV